MGDIPVYEGHHNEGPFNRSAAINTAARLADADGRWDVGIVIDSDVFLPIAQVRKAIASAEKGKVTWAHTRWRGFHENDTLRLIKDPDRFGPDPASSRDMDLIVERTTPISWSCCVAVPRATFDDMGGFDERFIGWGFEDGAWAALVRGLYKWARIDGDMYHWWHPRSDERIVAGQPSITASPDYVRNGLYGRRYMVAAIRDHRTGDQPGEERLSDAMVETHVRNLTIDDRKFLNLAKMHGLPDWSDWWPTLEELRDGAREYNMGRVTVVVTSGGKAENWPVRREYLRASLASLNEKVSGPIVQRVVYTDWPDEVIPEVDAIAKEHGFYLAGNGQHGHTGMRQRMWRYLSRHAVGDFIFGAEDDFLYERDVDLTAMMAVLRGQPHVLQLALLRDNCYPDEKATEPIGNILGYARPAFEFHDGWFSHRLLWTNNPSLFRMDLTRRTWPPTGEDPVTGRGPGSEVVFGKQLMTDERVRFGWWGDGTPWIRHIGEVRAGTGY